jgi:methylenetetrahydrofolate dehydrogenase (NADP+) / methenyltetrahydrofolate cyclohydrolase / formyltetrahydrofolate synthetase
MKSKAAEEVGMAFQHVALPEEATAPEIVSIVKKLNDDDTVSGILVQLPLGPNVGAVGERTVTEAVSPQKDVDGCVQNFPPRFRALG